MTTPQSPAEPPVGGDFGLEPLQPREVVIPPISSYSLVSDQSYRNGSEFGGVRGMIQPPPHTPTASERLRMIYAIDPMDPGTRSDSVAPPELDGDFGSGPY